MISLAMVLILILGINFVFRSATDAVGAGQALNGINSDAQSAQPVLFDDLRNVSKNPPCFIIASQLVTQFLNSDDAKTSSDPTVISPTTTAAKRRRQFNHRQRHIKPDLTYSPPRSSQSRSPRRSPEILRPRQLPPPLRQRRHLYGSESSDDAYIEFGHAALPTNDLTAYYGPSSSRPTATTGVYNGAIPVTGIPAHRRVRFRLGPGPASDSC